MLSSAHGAAFGHVQEMPPDVIVAPGVSPALARPSAE
jgi:hypothetical protein